MSDIFTLDENNNAAVRTVGVKAGAVESNQPDIFTTDENGNAAVRVVGGGDNSNLGYFATLEALQEAYPTAEPGNWAIVGTTDTVWVWDEDTTAWVDTDQKGQVTSVNNQTGAVTVQETLVSGTNIKTINNNSILGSGDLTIGTTPATAPTLVSADWSTNTQTITVLGVTSSNVVFVSPTPASVSDYTNAGIICTAQGTDSLSFSCVTTPTNDITLNVVIF